MCATRACVAVPHAPASYLVDDEVMHGRFEVHKTEVQKLSNPNEIWKSKQKEIEKQN